MTDDIKDLLTQLTAKIWYLEGRIKALEAKSHDQITLEDYYKKYGTPVAPNPLQPTTQPWIWATAQTLCSSSPDWDDIRNQPTC